MGKVVKGETTLSLESIPDKVRVIISAAKNTVDKLQKIKNPEDFLFKSKFGSLGTSWAAPEQDDDLGEQIQQSMTMLVTCYAIKYFNQEFFVNPGDKNGPDLWNKEIICEVFAAKDPWNNNKLYHDLNAVAEKANANQAKYIFCCSDSPLNLKKHKRCSHKNVYDLEVTPGPDGGNGMKIFAVQWKDKGNGGNKYCATIIHITSGELRSILSAPSGVSGLSSQEK